MKKYLKPEIEAIKLSEVFMQDIDYEGGGEEVFSSMGYGEGFEEFTLPDFENLKKGK